MPTLSQLLGARVQEWRKAGYPSDTPEVAELLQYQRDDDGRLRFLRKAQLEALEVYFYLRTVLGNKHVSKLYEEFFGNHILKALNIPITAEEIANLAINQGREAVFERIRTDNEFVKTYKLETVREMMTLGYSSYILALAMGAGKTMLIGTIIACEFALALETKDPRWLKNALVFAPGKTILRSLRELQLSLEKILPPRFYRHVAQNLKFVVASEAKTLPVIPDNNYYVIITNTEKIRLQARPARRKKQTRMQFNRDAEEAVAEANLRLQQIASLNGLGVFSDEAHGLYGQDMKQEIKKVRQTVDYIADNTDVRVVVNTTGTPYFQKQMLKEVVYWYGLAEGIEDGILKSVKDSMRGYAKIDDESFLREVLTDFFTEYGDVKAPNGTPAKLAVYFPQVDDLKKHGPRWNSFLRNWG